MDSIYTNTKVASFKTSKGQTYYLIENSGSWKKKCKCPKCHRHGVLSFKIMPIFGTDLRYRVYVYACTDCDHEHEPQFLKKRNAKSLESKIKTENNNQLLVSILKIHNRRGNKDFRATIDYIEKKLGIKNGWLNRRANQQGYYRAVDQEIIDEINGIKD